MGLGQGKSKCWGQGVSWDGSDKVRGLANVLGPGNSPQR